MDSNDYYGGFWASFNLEALQTHAAKAVSPKPEPVFQSDNLNMFLETCHIENVDLKWLVDGDGESSPNKASMLKASRHYNIDLSPTLLYSLGGMVKLLISSNICRYAEFRAVDRVATLLNGEIRTVPCSRSDVFVTSEVNVVEKRIMMKLIETCMELKEGQEEFEANREKTFQEYLRSKKAPAKVQHYILNALSMVTEETSFSEGVTRLNKFVESLGRYGNSPFLFPMYGCGEIPQCFCRLCAVFGGIYCLQRNIKTMKRSDGRLALQLETGEDISVGDIVFGPKTMRMNNAIEPDYHLARGILIGDQPMKDTNEKPKGGGVEFIRLTHEKAEAHLIQLSHFSGCCPKDVYVYHFISKVKTGQSPREALAPFIEQIFPTPAMTENQETEEKPSRILFELFFTIPIVETRFQVVILNIPDLVFPETITLIYILQVSDNIHVAGGPGFHLDYEKQIEEAQEIFLKLYPDEEFLPRAPEPEEIIMDGYDDKDEAEADAVEESLEPPSEEVAQKEEDIPVQSQTS